jgi:hypothetical protein
MVHLGHKPCNHHFSHRQAVSVKANQTIISPPPFYFSSHSFSPTLAPQSDRDITMLYSHKPIFQILANFPHRSKAALP